MSVALLVKKAREERGYSQGFLSSSVGIAQSTWSKYESCKVPMPNDIAHRAIQILQSHRTKAEYNFNQRIEFFNVPVLNNVDENSVVILDSLIEELEEAIESCKELKRLLRNKRNREHITENEWDKVLICEEQIADLKPAIKLHQIKMIEDFDMDLEKLEKIIQIKLKTKNYIK